MDIMVVGCNTAYNERVKYIDKGETSVYADREN